MTVWLIIIIGLLINTYWTFACNPIQLLLQSCQLKVEKGVQAGYMHQLIMFLITKIMWKLPVPYFMFLSGPTKKKQDFEHQKAEPPL